VEVEAGFRLRKSIKAKALEIFPGLPLPGVTAFTLFGFDYPLPVQRRHHQLLGGFGTHGN
jgi:hypothetical protein